MDKKTRTRILIVIVSAVWLYNIYKTYMNYQVKEELTAVESTYNTSNFSPLMFNKDTFDLELPEVDPFLKRVSQSSYSSNKPSNSSSVNTSNKNNKKQPKPREPVVQKSWPQIKYFGFIKSHSKDDALCLLQINGRNSKVSKGDNLSGVYISQVYRDSVLVVFEGEKKTFKKG